MGRRRRAKADPLGRARVLSAFAHREISGDLLDLPGARVVSVSPNCRVPDSDEATVELLLSGLLAQQWQTEERVVVELLGPGDVVRADFEDRPSLTPAGCKPIALTHARVLAVPIGEVVGLLGECPGLAVDLGARLVRRTRRAEELRLLHARLVGSNLTVFLAWLLLAMHEIAGVTHILSGRVTEGLSQAELATVLGSKRESANRSLARLHREGSIEVSVAGVSIRDVDGLRRRAEPALALVPLTGVTPSGR